MLQILATNAMGKPYSVKDIRALQKKLKAIEPSLRTEFMREVKRIGKEPNKAIKSAIPSQSPLSGMNPSSPRGRNATLQWGKTKKGGGGPKSTTIRFRTAMGGKSLTTSLLSIRLNSGATSVADMAGRSGNSIGAGYRRTGFSKPMVYTYADGTTSVIFKRPATRRRGEAFIENLNKALANRPSRMAWKAVEKSLPKISKDVQYVVDKWSIRASKGF